MYAAVSGSVTGVNERLSDDPKLLNSSPEQDGWIVQLNVTDSVQQEQKELLDTSAYSKFCEEEDKNH